MRERRIYRIGSTQVDPSGGTSGDATAANQATQITAANLTNTNLTAANTSLDNIEAYTQSAASDLTDVNTALGTPTSPPATISSGAPVDGDITAQLKEVVQLLITYLNPTNGGLHSDLFAYIKSGGSASTNKLLDNLIALFGSALPLPTGAATSALQTTLNGLVATAANQATQITALQQMQVDLDILAAFILTSDTYTSAVPGTTTNTSTKPKSTFTINSIKTGAVTSYTINLEGSMDGTNWFTIGTVTGISAATQTDFVSNHTVLYYRINCAAFVLCGGTNVIVQVLAIS